MWITKCVENPQSLLTLFTSRRVEGWFQPHSLGSEIVLRMLLLLTS